ncbi:MAG: DUF4279 domain-containing protein [Nitrospira sp.]|nr:MAG: DUF4279 domain-containing protein [Nitrospira sp.]
MIGEDMSSRAPVIRTEFFIEGDELDPDEFTRLLEIRPYRTGKKGELSSHPAAARQGVKNPSTFWFIEVEQNSYDMDEGVQTLLAQVWPHRDKIKEYLKTRPTVTVGMNTTIHIDKDRPVYEISLDSIKKLAELECRFMLNDIYPLD